MLFAWLFVIAGITAFCLVLPEVGFALAAAAVVGVLYGLSHCGRSAAPKWLPNSAAGLGEGSTTLRWGPQGWGTYTDDGRFFPSG